MSSIIRSTASSNKANPVVAAPAGGDSRVAIGMPTVAGQPHIRLIKRNDQVETIEVICGCGQCITLQLEFPENQGS